MLSCVDDGESIVDALLVNIGGGDGDITPVDSCESS